MSGEWYNQQPYSQPYYPPQQPPGHYPPHQQAHQPQPQTHYHQQPQAVPTIDHQYLGYPQNPQEYHYSQQPQVQPQSMPLRSGRNINVDPAYQHTQDLYAQQNVDTRLRSTRSTTSYAAQQPVASEPDPRLRQRSARVNYKEPDDEFVPEEDQASYGVASSRPRRAQSARSYTEPYEAEEQDTVETHLLQTQQQLTVEHNSSGVNGTIDPAVTTVAPKEEEEDTAYSQHGRRLRAVRKTIVESSDEEEEALAAPSRRVSRKGNEAFIASDDDEDKEVDLGDDPFGARPSRLTRSKASRLVRER
ncbi:hypothetical protein CPB86DRAFT_75200, partial [Serendipita vermifera]